MEVSLTILAGLFRGRGLVPLQSGFDKQILGKKAESIHQNQIA
jgi:hypothetical protein